MNRRNVLKSAIAAFAAVVGWKRVKAAEPTELTVGLDSAPVDMDDYTMVTVYINGVKVSEKPVKAIESRWYKVEA